MASCSLTFCNPAVSASICFCWRAIVAWKSFFSCAMVAACSCILPWSLRNSLSNVAFARLVVSGVDLTFFVAHYHVRVRLGHFLGNQSNLRIADRLPLFNQILFERETRLLISDYTDMYMSRAILIDAFSLLVIGKTDVYVFRLSNVNGNPFMRRCFPGVNVNPRTWLVKLGSARVNPKSVADARFVLPIN